MALKTLQVLGEADRYNPPNILSMDHQPKRSRPNHSAPIVTVGGPEIHVHFNSEGLGKTQFGGSMLGNLVLPSSSIVQQASPEPELDRSDSGEPANSEECE
jgi:hypothetical protein